MLHMRLITCASLLTLAFIAVDGKPVNAEVRPSQLTISGLPPFIGGIDYDLRLGETPFRTGGLVRISTMGAQPPWNPTFSAWGGLTVFQDVDSSLDLLVGGNYTAEPESPSVAIGPSSSTNSHYGYLLAASYTVTGPRFWLRFVPQFVFLLSGSNVYPYLRSGLPLAEVGTSLGPNLDLSLGISASPIRVTVRF
ncbi:hypothetical protein D3C87_1270360 [compost metagenome]